MRPRFPWVESNIKSREPWEYRNRGLSVHSKYLAEAGAAVLRAAAETLFQVTGVCQRPPQVALTGDTVRKPPVAQGALTTALPTKPFFAGALARKDITLGTRGANSAAVASLRERKGQSDDTNTRA